MNPTLSEHQSLIERTLSSSFLAETPPDLRDHLLDTAELILLEARTVAYRPYEPGSGVLILSGLLRAFLIAPDGRQLTIKYGVPGDLFGIPSLVGGPLPVSVEALQETRALRLRAEDLEELAIQDGATGWRLATKSVEISATS